MATYCREYPIEAPDALAHDFTTSSGGVSVSARCDIRTTSSEYDARCAALQAERRDWMTSKGWEPWLIEVTLKDYERGSRAMKGMFGQGALPDKPKGGAA